MSKTFGLKILLTLNLILFLGVAIVTYKIFIENKSICRDCNVILISLDTLRQDHLGLYGYEKDTSPNLDKYSEEATVFTNAFSTSSLTLPSHASIFTSRIPSHVAIEQENMIDYKIETLVEVLREKGYYTHAFKPHNTFISEKWGFDQGFDIFESVRSGKNFQDADLIFPRFNKWLEENKNEKFFAFIHTMQIHKPYCPPDAFDLFKGDYNGDVSCSSISDLSVHDRKVDQSDIPRYISLYDGEIRYTDFYLGQLFKKLEELKLDDKTIVVLLSDHGEEFGERGRVAEHGGKYLNNEIVKIPLIVKAPNLRKGVVEENISTVDVAPTILDLLGITMPSDYQGVSVRKRGDRPIYLESEKARGVILNEWKLLTINKLNEVSLYNLKDDPGEKINLAKENVEVKENLLAYIRFLLNNPIKLNSLASEQGTGDKEISENLKNLGY